MRNEIISTRVDGSMVGMIEGVWLMDSELPCYRLKTDIMSDSTIPS
jgi:hypothetical protein